MFTITYQIFISSLGRRFPKHSLFYCYYFLYFLVPLDLFCPSVDINLISLFLQSCMFVQEEPLHYILLSLKYLFIQSHIRMVVTPSNTYNIIVQYISSMLLNMHLMQVLLQSYIPIIMLFFMYHSCSLTVKHVGWETNDIYKLVICYASTLILYGSNFPNTSNLFP
jgi:hypothetical protein